MGGLSTWMPGPQFQEKRLVEGIKFNNIKEKEKLMSPITSMAKDE
jgi:hypothetical protein